MPCLSYEPSYTDSRGFEKERLKSDNANLEAALCTALAFIEKSALIDEYISVTDWKEAGITPSQAQSWWIDHKKKDQMRRAAELKAEAKRLAIVEKVAILQTKTWSELTKTEIKFLSIHAKK